MCKIIERSDPSVKGPCLRRKPWLSWSEDIIGEETRDEARMRGVAVPSLISVKEKFSSRVHPLINS